MLDPVDLADGARPTIVDVARRAGVSVASVSKVLRSAYGVSEAMRERVQKVIAELDYRPLASARGMRGRTFTIGLIAAEIRNPFVGLLVEGVLEGLSDSGCELLIGPTGVRAGNQRHMIEAMRDRQMDGIVMIAPALEPADLDEVARRTPSVVIGRHGPAKTYDSVAVDDYRGSELIVDHLVALGHRDIAFIAHEDGSPQDPHQPQAIREDGYRAAMAKHGLGDRSRVVRAAWNEAGGRDAALSLLQDGPMPTAVHAGADVVALSMMDEFVRAGIAVPGNVSIAGFDNTPVAAMQAVSLTSVDQGGLDLGKTAATLLLQRIDGRENAEHVVKAPSLIPRSTTAEPRAR